MLPVSLYRDNVHPFNLNAVDASWKQCIETGISLMDPDYLASLTSTSGWLPGSDKIFNAFSLPVQQVKYVLMGESPYPRPESANGYAFWDASVNELWSATGLSKKVNRATSLRNIIKMLLIAEGMLDPHHTTQESIVSLNKNRLIQTNAALFGNLIQHGFLLLNATPVLQASSPLKDARAWHPFTQHVLRYLLQHHPEVQLLLLGRIANTIDQLLPEKSIRKIYAEHPYNLSFITNSDIIDFFKPLHLLINI